MAKRYTYTVKTPLGKALILVLIVGLAVFLFRLPDMMTGIDGTHQGFTGRKDGTSLRWEYSLLDGTSDQHFSYDEPQTCLLSCVTESGTLTAELRNSDGAVLFRETFRESCEYTLDLIGDVTLHLEAEEHTGSISLQPLPEQ